MQTSLSYPKFQGRLYKPKSFVVKSLDLHRDIVTNHQIPPEIVHETTWKGIKTPSGTILVSRHPEKG